MIHFFSDKKIFEDIKINIVVQKMRKIDGNAAASIKSCSAYEKADVEKVSKLNGLKINVIGSSFKISIPIKTPINVTGCFKVGK